ncbi:hypothetical protein B0H14DRAFT_3868497 [Mycena olivaceomarginata]|nr:hypothetical protein B0H14DRAFT_3868497 [Mycena olivaceomarginata]
MAKKNPQSLSAALFTNVKIFFRTFFKLISVLYYSTRHPRPQLDMVILVRIHALYDRNLRLLVSVLGISLPLLAFIFWSFLGEGSKSDPVLGLPGCHTSLPKSASFRAFSALVSSVFHSQRILDLAAAWEALFLYDTMMFGLTVFKLILPGAGRTRSPTIFQSTGLSCEMPNLSGSLSTFASWVNKYFAPFMRTDAIHFQRCSMSVTLMARLMLNLYNAADAGNGELADFDSHCGVKLYFAGTQPIGR